MQAVKPPAIKRRFGGLLQLLKAGSVSSIFLASTLVKSFSGKGLVPDAIANAADFHLAVAIATGLTVILATQIGFPISTTHGLTGALVGAGLVAIGPKVNLATLQKSFVLPLVLSPLIAIPLGIGVYALFHYLRISLGIQKEWRTAGGQNQLVMPMPVPNAFNLPSYVAGAHMAVDAEEKRTQYYTGDILGVQIQQLVDASHFLSAGVVSFARGLNDTPKIVSLILIIQALSIQGGAMSVALAMAVGGLLNAHKVAQTMSKKITSMNAGQGFAANSITGILVIAASSYGLPVSTTHVAVGSIFGVGLIAKKANARVFYQILLSWILTLPTAAVLSGIFYWVLHR